MASRAKRGERRGNGGHGWRGARFVQSTDFALSEQLGLAFDGDATAVARLPKGDAPEGKGTVTGVTLLCIDEHSQMPCLVDSVVDLPRLRIDAASHEHFTHCDPPPRSQPSVEH